MKITLKAKKNDPDYAIMQGNSPMSKEFNKRSKKMFEEVKFFNFTFESMTTMLLEILCDDYNERNKVVVKKEQSKGKIISKKEYASTKTITKSEED